jgi:hypothetical protein
MPKSRTINVIGEEHVSLSGADKTIDFIKRHRKDKKKVALVFVELARNKKNLDAARKLGKNDIKFLGSRYGKQLEPHFTRLLRGYASMKNANIIPVDMSAEKTPEHEKFVKEMKIAFKHLKQFNKITSKPGEKAVSELGTLFLEKNVDEQLRLFSLYLLHILKGNTLREKVITDNVANEIERRSHDSISSVFLVAGANHTTYLSKKLKSNGYSTNVSYTNQWSKRLQTLPEVSIAAARYLKGDKSETNSMKIVRLIFDWFEFPKTKDTNKLIHWVENFKINRRLPNTVEEAKLYHTSMIESMKALR